MTAMMLHLASFIKIKLVFDIQPEDSFKQKNEHLKILVLEISIERLNFFSSDRFRKRG